MNRVFVDGVEVFDKIVTIINEDPVSVTITDDPPSEGNSGGGPGEEN